MEAPASLRDDRVRRWFPMVSGPAGVGGNRVNTTVKLSKEFESRMIGAQIPFESVQEPGAYLSNWSGHLIRVPEDGVKAGRSPLIEILGKEPFIVTKLSDDPYITLTKARMLAANLDLQVNF